MRNKNIIIVLFVIIISQLIITMLVSLKNRDCKKALVKTTLDGQYISSKLTIRGKRELLCFKAPGNRVDKAILLTKQDGIKSTLLVMLQNEENYILRLPESLCPSCNERLLSNLSNINPHILNNMLVIAGKFNLRQIAVYCQEGQVSEPFTIINKENIIEGLDLEQFNTPFILNVKKNGVLKSVFFLDEINIEYIIAPV
ncbi:MAG TPA: hypothetical protein VLZ83_07600 [Edaphocola sp.]|nr:hypothetical protein [Edaphocola sp.]